MFVPCALSLTTPPPTPRLHHIFTHQLHLSQYLFSAPDLYAPPYRVSSSAMGVLVLQQPGCSTQLCPLHRHHQSEWIYVSRFSLLLLLMLFFTFVCYDGLDKMSDYDMKKPVWRPVMKQNLAGGRNREIAHWNQNNLINTAFKSNITPLCNLITRQEGSWMYQENQSFSI